MSYTYMCYYKPELIMLDDLIQRLRDWYYYLFPMPIVKESKEAIELDDKESLIYKNIPDELEALKICKRKKLNPILYMHEHMKLCQACEKYRYQENIAYMSKPQNSDFYVYCKDDEACSVAIKSKINL